MGAGCRAGGALCSQQASSCAGVLEEGSWRGALESGQQRCQGCCTASGGGAGALRWRQKFPSAEPSWPPAQGLGRSPGCWMSARSQARQPPAW